MLDSTGKNLLADIVCAMKATEAMLSHGDLPTHNPMYILPLSKVSLKYEYFKLYNRLLLCHF